MNDTWVEVDKAKILHNYGLIRELLGHECRLMAVVKANAYGHGMIDFSCFIQEAGVDWYSVGTLDEALALRQSGIVKPILVFTGSAQKEIFHEAANQNISLTISEFGGLELLKGLSQQELQLLKIHLKIDTGMHRQGFGVAQVPMIVDWLQSNNIPPMLLEGVYTHFGAAENPVQKLDTDEQIAQLGSVITILRAAGFSPMIHSATTTSMLIFPQSRFDLVRVGAGLYGIWPSQESKIEFEKTIPLQAALSWKSRINEIKCLRKGSKIGYGFTATLEKDSTIAICSVGYWHGYRRHLSNVGQVLVRGKLANIVGRVSMYLTAIDVSDIPEIKVGEVVTLIGKDQNQEITLEKVSLWANTLNKEIVSGINPLVPRRYI